LTFRIFTNDRGKVQGVPMYSCLKEVQAASESAALRECPHEFNEPPYLPAVAVRWPAESDDDKRWLQKHVGPGL
jgi:hypothetical protein